MPDSAESVEESVVLLYGCPRGRSTAGTAFFQTLIKCRAGEQQPPTPRHGLETAALDLGVDALHRRSQIGGGFGGGVVGTFNDSHGNVHGCLIPPPAARHPPPCGQHRNARFSAGAPL